MTLSTHAFRMTKSDREYSWCQEKYENLPIIREHDGTVSQPLTFYFGYLARTKTESIASMGPTSYTLREWIEFLWRQGLGLREGGNDETMHRFVQAQRELDRTLSESHIAVKLQRIYQFYLHLPDAMRFWEDGMPVEEFVGEAREGRSVTTITKTIKGKTYTRWSGRGKIKQSTASPSVLTDDEVTTLYAAARTVDAKDASGQPLSKANLKTSIMVGERNWLLANVMGRGGLRAAETTVLSCNAITCALRLENLLKPVEKKFGPIKSVADLADVPDAQEMLLTALKAFNLKKGRMFIYVDIVGKGDKRRKAAFPVELIEDLLVVGVWTVRRFQLAEMTPSPESQDAVFLSFKSGDKLLAGSVSGILKSIFVKAHLEGSGHELRKYYATATANRILKKNIDELGYITQAVLNTVYEQVASALGHANVNTTTKHYVNVAMVNYTGLEARRQRRKILHIWEALIDNQDRLDQERIRLCGTAIKSIATAPRESDLFGIMRGALTDPLINPDGMIKFANPKPNLRLVASNPI